MGNSLGLNNLQSIKKINFEYIQKAINNNDYIIINTLQDNNQECLIVGTISPEEEIKLINEFLKTLKQQKIIIYGKNNLDEKIFIKYQQLINLGFTNVNIYIGGMFEWLLLQEIYGDDQFPTTSSELDILKYI
jgi:hypothetical protein